MNKTIATRIVTCLVALAALTLILGASCNSTSGPSGNPSQGTGQSTNAVVLTNAVLVTPSIPVWCWAATTSEVLNFYGFTNSSQCQLVSLVNNNNNVSCCPTNTTCVAVPRPDQLQSLISNLSTNRLIASYNPAPITNFGDVQTQLTNGNPIMVLYRGSDTSGHFALIYGYDPVSQEVYIHDPLIGGVLVPFGSVFNYDGRPIWAATFTFSH
jgi:hypothetical protein